MAERGHEITVAAGLIWGPDGRVLVSRRLPTDRYHAGRWELPGGKLEPGETPAEALVREIREELNLEVEAGPQFARVTHRYPHGTVTLIGLHARYTGGEPELIGVAEARWAQPEELGQLQFPEANARLFDSDWRTPPPGWVEGA